MVATLHNHRSDKTVYPPRDQELPAVYSTGSYYRLITTEAGQIKEYNAGWNTTHGPWVPGNFIADENWAAMVDQSGYGIDQNLMYYRYLGTSGGMRGGLVERARGGASL